MLREKYLLRQNLKSSFNFNMFMFLNDNESKNIFDSDLDKKMSQEVKFIFEQ